MIAKELAQGRRRCNAAGGPSIEISGKVEMDPKSILADQAQEFRRLKELAEKAMNQVSDQDFFRTLDDEANSIAFLTKHIAGNLKSRWTDVLTTDGEKPDRRRDSEFWQEPEDSRKTLLARWEVGWSCLFTALESLTPEDLGKTIHIRNRPFRVAEAVLQAQSHIAYHIGQLVFLAKHFASSNWQTLSRPRRKPEQ